MITQDELKSLLHYDPETGVFTRLVTTSSRATAGDVAGWNDGAGYLRISVAGKIYKAHRLACLYMTGSFPKNLTDHINGFKGDNRWCNLMQATAVVNGQNSARSANNSSGITGVSWNKRAELWHSRITSSNARLFLGTFDNIFDAVCARRSAELQHNFHQNHGRTV